MADRATPRPVPSPGFQFGHDATLLSQLVADGRASFEDLAATMGTSRQSAWRRVKSLTGSVIWGVAAVVDHRRLGWRQYVITIAGAPDYDTIAKVEEAEQAARSWGTLRILQSVLLRGSGWRLMLHVAARDSLVLEAFLQSLADRFPGIPPPQVDEVEHVIRDGGFSNPSRDALEALRLRRPMR